MNNIFLLLILLFCFTQEILSTEQPATEVRAVWLTTNYGLDWPHSRISQDEQKKELITILDELKKININTVIFQARARGEVFYNSRIEHMS